MNSLDLVIKSQEALVITRNLEVTQALNAKRYANKYNTKLMAELRKNLEDAQVRSAVATTDLMRLYVQANSVKAVA
jgi:hypothetical protein